MLIKKKKKRNPAELVTSAARVGSWYDRLSSPDRAYVDAVMMAVRIDPHVSISSVSRSLIKELGLSVSVTSVREILKKML